MTTIDDGLRARIHAYLEDEPLDADRAILERLVASDDAAVLARCFGAPIAFGTAGLRAEVLPGPSGMNLRNVVRATRALLEVVLSEVEGARERGIVVAHDARPSSAGFARAVRELAASTGFVVHAFEEPTPTPIAAFAAQRLGTAAAIVITASHNPPADNGMKVYGPNASQIVPPWDRAVAERMHDARPSPRLGCSDEDRARIRPIPPAIEEEHRARSLAIGATHAPRAPIRVAYTAIHGVGARFVRAALDGLGGIALASVESQEAPDGAFPTTRKPNPEHEDTLAQVVALARSTDAHVFLANDPDADRLAVGVRHGGAFVTLRGDELGVLLGGTLAARGTNQGAVIRTIVSSPWLGLLCEARGVRSEVTLTGHKWIHDRAIQLESEGIPFTFGYEEALGYAFPNGVRDKDGIAAAVVVARLASEAAADGATLIDLLERIARESALHASRQLTLAFDGEAGRRASESALASLATTPPMSLGGRPVVAWIDGLDCRILGRDGSIRPLGVPSSSLVGFELEGGIRVLMRPSGTEPTLKIYLDARTSLALDESYLDARARADATLASLEAPLRAFFAGA